MEPDAIDVKLIERCKSGELSAFELLFKKYQSRIYNIVCSIVGDETESADLTQEIFLDVWRSVKTLRRNEAFASWLYRIALNRCRNHLKTKERRLETQTQSLDEAYEFDFDASEEKSTATIQIPDWTQNPERVIMTSELETKVREALQSLPQLHREVIVMHHLEGIEVEQIAKVLEVSQGTIKSRLARARESLRRKLAKYIER